MATINDFEDLQIWRLSREQCKEVSCYLIKFLAKREFELISQIKRSSGSVMDNIAEGFERGGNSEFFFSWNCKRIKWRIAFTILAGTGFRFNKSGEFF